MFAILVTISLIIMVLNVGWVVCILNKAPASYILFNNNFYAKTIIATAAAPVLYAW